MSQQRAFLGALALVAGVAFLVGRASAPDVREAGDVAAPVQAAETRSAPRDARYEPAPTSARRPAAEPGAHRERRREDPDHPVHEHAELPEQASLRAFQRARDPKRLAALAAALGKLRDPEVEALALRVARHGTDVARRRAAFEILDRIDSPLARPVALEVLSREADRGLRRAALFAIDPPRGVSLQDAAPVVAAMTAIVSSDPDPLLRRRAAVTLGRWQRTAADLRPLLTGLAQDTSINVRAGCAFGLEVAGRRDAAITAALVASLGNQREDPLVRENAWKALGALGPLSADAHAAWKAFKAQRDAQAEAN